MERYCDSGCTDPTQATARLVIVLVRSIQKCGTERSEENKSAVLRRSEEINLVKWKRTFRSDRPKWPDRSKWAMQLQIPVEPNRNGPFQWMYQPKFSEFWVEWKGPTELLEMRFEFPFTRLALLAMAFWTFQSWRVLNLGKHFTTQNTFSALFRWRT